MNTVGKKIGYSFWGFLGNGVVDTPDGGRSHRSSLIAGLLGRGHQIIMLQNNRDKIEAAELIELGQIYSSDDPELDVLFLEWRWPIPNRNINPNTDGYTPDLQRQRELIQKYGEKIPLVVWDKDQQLAISPKEDRQWLINSETYVLEPSLYPFASDRTRCLFPLEYPITFDLHSLNMKQNRKMKLVYIGNQYDRDKMYYKYLGDAAHYCEINVYGKWNRVQPVNNIIHHGRVAFEKVANLYNQSLVTVLLAPDRYLQTGQYTQRIFESILGGCIPLVPREYRGARQIFPEFCQISSGYDIAKCIQDIQNMTDTDWKELLTALGECLEPFNLKHTLNIIERAIQGQVPRYNNLTPRWLDFT